MKYCAQGFAFLLFRKAGIDNTLWLHFHTVSTMVNSLPVEGRGSSSPFLVPGRPWPGSNHPLIQATQDE